MNEDLRRRLLDLAEQDQVYAQAVNEASQSHEPHRGKFLFDIPRTEWLPEYFVGEDGCAAAWLIAQHGGPDPSFRVECEAALAVAVAVGDAKPGQLAALRDRIELEAGRVQLYGTHLEPDGESWRPVRGVDDSAAVDARRAALGLKSWPEYLADCLEGHAEI